MNSKDLSTYNHDFYENQTHESARSAQNIIPLIEKWIEPKSIIDVGCGVGSWLNEWKKFGNKKVEGFDGSFVSNDLILLDKTEFTQIDINNKLPQRPKVDLVICLEVAEHLSAYRADSFIHELTEYADVILFSAAIEGQEGTHHVNEQFLSYWIELFKKRNYTCIDCVRPAIWNDDQVMWWYRQNIVMFIKTNSEKINELIKLPSFEGVDIVHKELYSYKLNKLRLMESRLHSFKKNPFKFLIYWLRYFKNKRE